MRSGAITVLVVFVAAGCTVETDPCLQMICEHPVASAGKADTFGEQSPWTNWTRDILSTGLNVDLATGTATARIRMAPSMDGQKGASLDVHGLEVTNVSDAQGPLEHAIVEGRLDLSLPSHDEHTVVIDYAFSHHAGLKGLSAGGETFTWPYFCGNLFPCKPWPADGMRFDLSLTGVPEGEQAVYPAEIPADAPSYMLAWVTGNYTSRQLGTTDAGTEVWVWWRPGEESRAIAGTDGLVQVFDWLETTIGPYTFGKKVGSVSVRWGHGSAYGGMEHHPLWHVSDLSFDDFYVHAHEAAHGWFGDAVRMGCWEDFVLSEGTVSYLAARAIAFVKGPQAEFEIWDRFRRRLHLAVSQSSYGDGIAWPQTECNTVDLLEDNLYTSIPYMKGAFFYRAVEQEIGQQALTRAIARFYDDNAGKAATMQSMVDTIKAEAAITVGESAAQKVDELARSWLQSSELPELPDMPPAP